MTELILLGLFLLAAIEAVRFEVACAEIDRLRKQMEAGKP